MATIEYINLYFPFDKPEFHKDERTAEWHVGGESQSDRVATALAMTFGNEPMALNMCLQKDYAERFDWIVTQFRDLAFSLVSSCLFYEDKDTADESTLDLYRQGIAAFGGIAPTYHISLYSDKPTIVWDFHSLLRGIQMMFSFALTDENRPLRICKHCGMAFVAADLCAAFCNPKCESRR